MSFDVEAATAAYVDAMGPERLARAEAFTTGGHWILLWSLLVSILAAYLVARSGLLGRSFVRNPDRLNRTAAVSGLVTFLLTAVLTLPWDLYTGWFRMHAYGRSSQPLWDFLGQWALGTTLTAVLGAGVVTLVYAFLRRTGQWWWLWASGAVTVVMSVMLLAAPVMIEPMFNTFKPLPAGPVRDALVPMAVEAGVPPERIFVYDGSRQSNNFTANAGGIGSTARIAVSDVAFKDATLSEVRGVTGHEIGHYVLHHTLWGIFLMSLMALVAFRVASSAYDGIARRLGISASISDPQGFPALMVTVSLVSFLATPLSATMSRHFEAEADDYSLVHVSEPDGLSTALVKTADYRNPRPGRLEEILFYDHPSVERRVRNAMTYKAAHSAAKPASASEPTP